LAGVAISYSGTKTRSRGRAALEHVFEGFANDGFAAGLGNLAQVLKLVEILLDYLAHVAMAG